MSTVIVSQDELLRYNSLIPSLQCRIAELSAEHGHPLTYKVRTYGCQLNESDSEKIEGILQSIGLVEASETAIPDFLILNTCTIRENADVRLFGNLGAYKSQKKENRDMFIAVCGCMMKQQENIDRIKKSFPYVDACFGPSDIHLLPQILDRKLSQRKRVFSVSEEDYLVDDTDVPVFRKRKFRALVPIMYGCNNFCTYCVVPYTRGRERSRDSEKILRQLRDLAAEGYKEVMLLGQNVNSYGNDMEGEISFAQLLEETAKIPGFSRIRFMTSHPKDISEDVIYTMKKYGNIERHLHLPMQSGSSAVLKRMNRHYDKEQYLRTALLFREVLPEATLTTDIIVGFPGETEEDFCETLEVVEKCRFDSAFTFQYSRRPGTKAASYEDQIPQDVVTERFGRLLELQNALTFKSNESVVGKTEEILIEGRSATAPNVLTGRTKSNRLVNFRIPSGCRYNGKEIDSAAPDFDADAFEGRLAMVRILKAKPYSVEGELESFIDEQ
ncbi:MAG: tRNA (N6-isopentenyl adenosine(37)-C2)-methylthiotransferase MiaB [Clostridiales bacterium]|nr:tRNA (N6-isopentenyl adenosine(37)-C2)-methylthiotransferase MiaB [Clostridiales bacterium]